MLKRWVLILLALCMVFSAALSCADWPKKAREILKTERPFLKKALEGFGFEVYPSDVNFILFSAPEDLAEKLLKKGILIRDCSNFRTLGVGDFRVAVRTRNENEALLQAIREVL